MSTANGLVDRYGTAIASLTAAMQAGDEDGFARTLADLAASRDQGLRTDLRELTDTLRQALDRFSVDSRLADLAEREVPDARHRLEHVLRLTDAAAHTTLDLVERSGPLAEHIGRQAAELLPAWQQFRELARVLPAPQPVLDAVDAFLPAAQGASEEVRSNLAEVLLAQGYQDLTGQIIRGVMQLVTEIEAVLIGLVRLSAGQQATGARREEAGSRGHGPVVPGVDHGKVVSGQQDVDALLSGLGM